MTKRATKDMSPRERLLSAFKPVDPVGVVRELERENFQLLSDRFSDAEAVERDQARQAGTGKPRGSRWPEVDKDIRQVLEANPNAKAKEIFNALPTINDNAGYYVDGDEIVGERNRTLSLSGFEKRVSKIRNQIKNAR